MKSAVTGMVVVFLTGSVTFSQVHIRENVAISPGKAFETQMEFPSGLLLLCKSTITVTITHGYDNLTDPNSHMDLVLVSPISTTISTDALHSFNTSWTSPELDAGSILKFAIIEHHLCTGTDTVEVTTITDPQFSPFDSVFSMRVPGRISRCNATDQPGWSELFFDVKINTTIDDIISVNDGMIHFGLCWWKTSGKPEPASGRLEIKGPCSDILDTVLTGSGGAITGEIDPAVAGKYTFVPGISKEATDAVHAVYYLGGNMKSGIWLFGDGSKGSADPAQDWYPLVFNQPMSFTTPYPSRFSLFLTPYPEEPLLHEDYAEFGVNDAYDCSTSRWSPSDPMTLTITSGSEYASLYTWDYGADIAIKLGTVANTTGQEIRDWVDAPYLIVDGKSPDSTGGWVVVRGESDGVTSTDSVQVAPPPVRVSVVPAEISTGETAAIVVKQRNLDGSLTDYPEYQSFEVGIFAGSKYANILTPDSTEPYFQSIRQEFSLVAADSIDSSVVTVGIMVEPVEDYATSIVPGGAAPGKKSGIKSVSPLGRKSRLKSTAAVSSGGSRKSVSFIEGNYGIAWVKIKAKEGEHSILLGETKYYYATEENDELIIHETPTPTNPGLNDVKFDPPVAASGSEKNPVYSEYKYPVYHGDTLKGTAGLPRGMIRLVGRYWEQGKTFKARLTAHGSDGISASVEIEVKKPQRLGSLYDDAKDVFDNTINIDDTCITYGGKYGIPPQLIKGQMEKEARTYNFGGNVGVGFAPAYRYEPYTVQFWPGVADRTRNPFYVTAANVNNPPIPYHKYVQDISYIYPNKTVWDVIYDHSQLVNDIPDRSHRLYGIRTYADTMNFSPYKTMKRIYNNFFNRAFEKYEFTVAAKKANAEMTTFLRDKWDGDMKGGKKGLVNIYAQTRIASSYGLLQMLYTTALERGYLEDISHLPENINVTGTVMQLSMSHQKRLLEDGLQISNESYGDWPQGFEMSFCTFVYAKWNWIEGYPREVVMNSRHFLPQH